jgi:multidrug efflux pump subunit AcrA (membrane-fusion protein)
MFARVQLALESVEDAVIVPQRAIAQTPAGGQIAYVVVDGRVVQRKIKTGVEQAGQVQVLEGVQPGEKVVVAGHENLRDGVEVRVVEPPKAQPGNGVGAAEKGGSGQ